MSNFFELMPGFSVFESLSKDSLYQQPPSDWWVVISDVKGSTKAIEAGRYKDVNTVGVASIVAITNAMKDEVFPFVFGGDGATALIPAEKKKAVEQELSALQNLSKNKYSLDLRVGMVCMSELLEGGSLVEVAKYLLPSKTPIAIFRGGGLTQAENLVKGEPDMYGIEPNADRETDLRTLACRWEPIYSRNGQILSLLVCAQTDDNLISNEVYNRFLDALSQILKNDSKHFNPVNIASMHHRPMMTILKKDLGYQKKWWRLIPRMVDSFLASLAFGLGLSRLFPSIHNYPHALASHSDYRKFDDVLRMVLDCSAEQRSAIQELCAQFYQEEQIFYGIHLSETALMTCQFAGFKEGNHLHFIDGGDGGYAMAAKQMKQQIKQKS